MLKIDFNQLDVKQLTALLKNLGTPKATPLSLIIIKISQAFCMYHQVSPHNYQIQNRNLSQSHPILINDLDNNFTYLVADDDRGRIINLYLINNLKQLVPANSLLTNVSKQSRQSNLDYFYYLTKKIERNLHFYH